MYVILLPNTDSNNCYTVHKNHISMMLCCAVNVCLSPKVCTTTTTMNLERLPNEEKLSLCRKYYLGESILNIGPDTTW